MLTYLIDYEGNIETPILGSYHLEGMTRIEAPDMLKEKIKEYAKDPIINLSSGTFYLEEQGRIDYRSKITYTFLLFLNN